MTTEEQTSLLSRGYNPDLYSLADDPLSKVQPTNSPGPIVTPTGETTNKISAAKAFGVGARRSVLPTIGGLAGGIAAPALAGTLVGGPIGTLAGVGLGIAGAIGGSVAAEKLQEEVPSIAPWQPTPEELAQASAEHPYATLAGELAPHAAALKPSLTPIRQSIQGIRNAQRASSLISGLQTIHPNEAGALINTGVGVALPTAQVGYDLVAGHEVDPVSALMQIGAGAVLTQPRVFMSKVGMHPTLEGIQESEAPFRPIAERVEAPVKEVKAPEQQTELPFGFSSKEAQAYGIEPGAEFSQETPVGKAAEPADYFTPEELKLKETLLKKAPKGASHFIPSKEQWDDKWAQFTSDVRGAITADPDKTLPTAGKFDFVHPSEGKSKITLNPDKMFAGTNVHEAFHGYFKQLSISESPVDNQLVNQFSEHIIKQPEYQKWKAAYEAKYKDLGRIGTPEEFLAREASSYLSNRRLFGEINDTYYKEDVAASKRVAKGQASNEDYYRVFSNRFLSSKPFEAMTFKGAPRPVVLTGASKDTEGKEIPKTEEAVVAEQPVVQPEQTYPTLSDKTAADLSASVEAERQAKLAREDAEIKQRIMDLGSEKKTDERWAKIKENIEGNEYAEQRRKLYNESYEPTTDEFPSTKPTEENPSLASSDAEQRAIIEQATQDFHNAPEGSTQERAALQRILDAKLGEYSARQNRSLTGAELSEEAPLQNEDRFERASRIVGWKSKIENPTPGTMQSISKYGLAEDSKRAIKAVLSGQKPVFTFSSFDKVGKLPEGVTRFVMPPEAEPWLGSYFIVNSKNKAIANEFRQALRTDNISKVERLLGYTPEEINEFNTRSQMLFDAEQKGIEFSEEAPLQNRWSKEKADDNEAVKQARVLYKDGQNIMALIKASGPTQELWDQYNEKGFKFRGLIRNNLLGGRVLPEGYDLPLKWPSINKEVGGQHRDFFAKKPKSDLVPRPYAVNEEALYNKLETLKNQEVQDVELQKKYSTAVENIPTSIEELLSRVRSEGRNFTAQEIDFLRNEFATQSPVKHKEVSFTPLVGSQEMKLEIAAPAPEKAPRKALPELNQGEPTGEDYAKVRQKAVTEHKPEDQMRLDVAHLAKGTTDKLEIPRKNLDDLNDEQLNVLDFLDDNFQVKREGEYLVYRRKPGVDYGKVLQKEFSEEAPLENKRDFSSKSLQQLLTYPPHKEASVDETMRFLLKGKTQAESDVIEKALGPHINERLSYAKMYDLIEQETPNAKRVSYGMEGKVSEAKREYDELRHTLETGAVRRLARAIESQTQPDQIDSTLYRLKKLPEWDAISDEVRIKVEKLAALKKDALVTERIDTSPRATAAYEGVSAWLAKANDAVKRAYTGLANIFRANPRNLEIPLENTYLGKSPEQYVMEQPNGKYMVNPNPHVGPMDTIHPGKLYNTREEAVAAAKQLHEHLQILDNLEAHGIRPKWCASTREALLNGHELPSNVQRVDVVIPDSKNKARHEELLRKNKLNADEQVELQNLSSKEDNRTLWQPDNLHENLPNTLGWAMIQYKTGPKGEKIAVVVEAQSRWGQSVRDRLRAAIERADKYEIQEYNGRYGLGQKGKTIAETGTPGGRTYSTREQAAKGLEDYKQQITNIDENHPLLRDYNRLILKAAIEQARKEGATHIMVSDAETAMMTEGHDLQAPVHKDGTYQIKELEGVPVNKEATDFYTGKVVVKNGTPHLYAESKTGYVNSFELSKNTKQANAIINANIETQLSQEPGMRLNYDKVLPKIASELTGDKGERVSLGEHKNAMERAGTINRQDEAGYQQWLRNEQKPRQNLIFRNPDGTPKTDVSGVMYDIRNVSKEPWTLYSKEHSEEAPLQNKWPSPFRSMTDTLRATGEESKRYMADKFDEVLTEAQKNYGRFGNASLAAIKTLNRKEQAHLDSVMTEMRRTHTDLTGQLSQKEKVVYGKLRELLIAKQREQIDKNEGVVDFNDDGRPFVRTTKIDRYYVPHVPRIEVIKEILNSPNSKKSQKLKQDFLDYQMSMKPDLTQEGAQELFDRYLNYYNPSKQKKSTDTHFAADRMAEGVGLPDSWRETNLEMAMSRYWKRVSMDRAYHDAIELDPEASTLLGVKKNMWGTEYSPERFSSSDVLVDETTKSILQHIRGERTPEEHTATAAASLATRLFLGPLTNIHIALSTPFSYAKYLPAGKTPGYFAHLATNTGKGITKSLERGYRQLTPNRRDNFLRKDATVAERLQALGDEVSNLTGREATEKWSKALSSVAADYVVNLHDVAAQSGNKKSLEFLKTLDSSYKPGESNLDDLATRLSALEHGAFDPRTMPKWMLSEGFVAPFFKLNSWNMGQMNNFNKFVLPRLKKGDPEPFLMSLFGGLLGGSIIKELRERLSDREAPHPSMTELTKNWSEIPDVKLAAYNAVAAASFAGVAGMWSIGAKAMFDIAYKNRPQGAAFPLDELITDTALRTSHVAQALMNGENPVEVAPRAVADFAKANVQAYRVVLNNLTRSHLLEEIAPGSAFAENEQKAAELSKAGRDLRVWKMANQLPYQEQGFTEANPYMKIPEKQFKSGSVENAVEMLPQLIERAWARSGGDIEAFKNQLRSLKTNQYPTMPDPETMPMTFARYAKDLQETKGPEEAGRIMADYFTRRTQNKMKSAIVPTL